MIVLTEVGRRLGWAAIVALVAVSTFMFVFCPLAVLLLTLLFRHLNLQGPQLIPLMRGELNWAFYTALLPSAFISFLGSWLAVKVLKKRVDLPFVTPEWVF